MDSASRILRKLQSPESGINAGQIVCAAWAKSVGSKVAAHSTAVQLVRTHLIIEVENALWQRNLFFLSRQILTNLAKVLGAGVVEDLEFRIMPRRIEPAQANASVRQDESDLIADPGLRRVYRNSRNRESA